MWQWMTRLCVLALFLLAGCQSTRDKNILLVGAMAGPEADLVKVAAEEAMQTTDAEIRCEDRISQGRGASRHSWVTLSN